jgi:hypothetical protein
MDTGYVADRVSGRGGSMELAAPAPQAKAAVAGSVAMVVRVVGFTLQLYEMSDAAAAARLLDVKLGLSVQLNTNTAGLKLSAGLTGTGG